ncbi:MAG TPA: hypothetical protein VLM05_10515, partial [Mycobacteriales bacterium]|nr:hypothetical protein [Mycobacteriales bacterium]
ATDGPTGDRPTGDSSIADKPAADKPAGDSAAADKPAGDKPAGDKPAGSAARADTSSGVRPADKPSVARPADKPSIVQAAEGADVDRPAGRAADRPDADRTAGRAADKADGDRPATGTGPSATGSSASSPPAGGKPAVTVTRGTTPGAATTATPLLSAERTGEFKQRWRDLQGDFVDDPQQAVRGAGDLAREVLQALADTIADPERVEGWKAGDGSTGTEDLRVALRQYRTLVDRLLAL